MGYFSEALLSYTTADAELGRRDGVRPPVFPRTPVQPAPVELHELYDVDAEQVLDRQEMTSAEAEDRNRMLRIKGEPWRWIVASHPEQEL